MKDTLFEAINSVSEVFFFGNQVPSDHREQIAARIAERQGKPHAYADMFAPTSKEMENGIRLFTGETVRPSASLRHVYGEEACRAMILLKPHSQAANAALKRASEGMLACLRKLEPNKHGMFCCGTCDPALWRHIAVGGLEGEEDWVEFGMKALKAHRDKEGKWRRFPFFYTLLALLEYDTPEAINEMRYAARECEAYLSRAKTPTTTSLRRTTIVERVLSRS
jgi:hypothetical protein